MYAVAKPISSGKTFKEDAPVYQAARYISSGKAAKDMENEKYVKANKRMWGI